MDDNKQELKQPPFKNIPPVPFVLLILITVFIIYQIIGSLFAYITLGENLFDPDNINATRIVVSASQFLFLLFPVIIINILRGNKFKEGFLLNKPDWRIVALSVIGIIAIQPLLQLILIIQNKIIFSLPFDPGILEAIKSFSKYLDETVTNLAISYSIPELITVIVVIALTPAVCEELMFRGLILKNLSAGLKPYSAVLLTGIIFAVFHFHPFNLIPLIILGIYISFTAFFSNSVYTAVIIHFINNLISVFSIYFFGKENPDWEIISNHELMQYGLLSIFTLAIFTGCIILTVRLYKINKKNEQFT
ncbi:MAG: CPBP family intramembrane metalloprotease [Ignavibacteria bacterium]|nr:CPBP family intramembrane metalloprotease [Ignavibacteria bacterium]